MHGGNREITGSQFVGQPIDLSPGVAEDDSLSDSDGLIEIGEGIQLPVFLFDSDIELLDTFEGKLSLLDQDTDWVAHELGGNLEDILWHGSGKEDDLCRLRQKLEDVVDLLGETTL